MTRINLIKPDDWHLHLRSGEALKSVVGMSAAQMGRAIIMPNLSPPVKSVRQAQAYRKEIMRALPAISDFNPLMALYLTDNTDPKEIAAAGAAPEVYAVKLYPAGSTTNSDNAVTNIINIYPALEAMQKEEMPLLVHGEVTDPEVDVFDRESVFIEKILDRVVKDFPGLKIVLEHITTKDAVDYVLGCKNNIAATITPHHLLANRNHMLVGGIKPHYYCLPVLKRQNPDQKALLKAAISGNPKFFLGTDSAPHSRQAKENACACAGIYSAPAALELYTQVFEQNHALDKLEGFASFFGADFYGLPRNRGRITLHRTDWTMAEKYTFGSEVVVPICAGEKLRWLVADES